MKVQILQSSIESKINVIIGKHKSFIREILIFRFKVLSSFYSVTLSLQYITSVVYVCLCLPSSYNSRLVAWMYALGYSMWSPYIQYLLWKVMSNLELICEEPRSLKRLLSNASSDLVKVSVNLYIQYIYVLEPNFYVSIQVTYVHILLQSMVYRLVI